MRLFARTQVGVRYRFDSDTDALVARMVSAPSYARKVEIDQLLRALKQAGVWSRLDGLWILAAHTSQAALLNWVQSNNLTNGGVTFTADRGYAGNGANSLSGAITATQTQDDTACGVYTRAAGEAVASSAGPFFTNSASGLTFNNGGGSNSGTSSGASATGGAVGPGYLSISRAAAGSFSLYKAGALLNTGGASTSFSTPITVSMLSASTTALTEVCAAHTGLSLDATQMSQLYTALNTYLSRVGAV